MSDNDHASFWWYIRWDKHCFIFVQPRSTPWSPCETPKLHHWTATGCDSPWSKRFLVTPSHQWCPLKIGDTPNHEKLEEFSPMFWWNMVKPPKISQVFFAATFPHLFGENLCHGARTSQEHHPGKDWSSSKLNGEHHEVNISPGWSWCSHEYWHELIYNIYIYNLADSPFLKKAMLLCQAI